MNSFEPFDSIGKEWALFGVHTENADNAMTVSFGEVGILWFKSVFTVFIRPSRYTYDLAEKSDYATLSFFDGEKEMLTYFGRTSGRDENKIEKSGLKTHIEENGLVFDNARLTFIGKKMYYTDIDKNRFLNDEINKCYPDGDYHRAYTYEIIKVIEK